MMKSMIALTGLAAILWSAGCGEKSGNAVSADVVGKTTALNFETTSFDFGTIQQGQVVEHEFSFTNTGEEDLVIGSAKPSCGCTVPEYPQKPLRPGESGVIRVKFDSSGKSGPQDKTVEISANTQPNLHVLHMKGNVQAPETTN